jgi:di/tricarboxylate transporter
MLLQLTGLGFLVLAIALGLCKKINVGLVAIALAFILALMGRVNLNVVFTGFPTKLFLTILGTMYFFCMLQENKTLELASRKIVSCFSAQPFWIPVVIYFVSYVMSAAGPGAISVQAVMVLFAMSLATQVHISADLLAAMAVFGSAGGTASPIALAGIIVTDLSANMGVPNLPLRVFYGVSLVHLAAGIIFYFALGGYKLKIDQQLQIKDLPAFNRDQKFSLAACLLLVILVVGLRYDIGLTCFVLALGLILLKAVHEKQAFAMLPWNVLLLICGVNVLMNVIKEIGGIKLFAAALATLMNGTTASALMAATAGFMAWFSSAHGVVLPALIPTVPDIVAQVGPGADTVELISAIVAAANIGGLGPMTTGGSLLMAAYVEAVSPSEEEQHKMFIHLFSLSALSVLVVVLFALAGGFRPFGG